MKILGGSKGKFLARGCQTRSFKTSKGTYGIHNEWEIRTIYYLGRVSWEYSGIQALP